MQDRFHQTSQPECIRNSYTQTPFPRYKQRILLPLQLPDKGYCHGFRSPAHLQTSIRRCHRYEPAAPHTPPSILLSNRQQQIGKISKAFTREVKKSNTACSVKSSTIRCYFCLQTKFCFYKLCHHILTMQRTPCFPQHNA